MVRERSCYIVFLQDWCVVFLVFSISGFEVDSDFNTYKLYIIIIGSKCLRLQGWSTTDRQVVMGEIGQRKNCKLAYSIILKFYRIHVNIQLDATISLFV